MVCDVKISSKELIRCKSYDLTGVSSRALRNLSKCLRSFLFTTYRHVTTLPRDYNVGRHLILKHNENSRLTVGRQTANSWPTDDRQYLLGTVPHFCKPILRTKSYESYSQFQLTDQLNGAEFSHFSLILKMTFARVVETIVSKNSCFQSYSLPEYHSTRTS